MPTSPVPFSVRQICACLQQIRNHLSRDTKGAVDAALHAVADDALSLIFIELSAQTVLFIRRDGTYMCPAVSASVPDHDGAELPRWLAYRSEPSRHPIADTLNAFEFFGGLVACMGEIASHNAELGRQLQALHAVHHSFSGELSGELSGDELTLNCAVSIAHAPDGTVRLELVLDHDELHPASLLLPSSRRQDGCDLNFVLLGNALVLHPCSLLRLRRLA